MDSPLTGAHQHRNIALAIAAAVELATQHGFPITPASIADGIRQTRWPAGWSALRKRGVEWILDVAHNPAGAWALRAGLACAARAENSRALLVFSCLRDKPIAEMAQILFPLFDQVILAPIHSARAAALGRPGAAARPPEHGRQRPIRSSRRSNGPTSIAQGGVVVVSGSVYLVGEARSLLLQEEVAEP